MKKTRSMRYSYGVSNKWEGYGSRNSESNPLKSSPNRNLRLGKHSQVYLNGKVPNA